MFCINCSAYFRSKSKTGSCPDCEVKIQKIIKQKLKEAREQKERLKSILKTLSSFSNGKRKRGNPELGKNGWLRLIEPILKEHPDCLLVSEAIKRLSVNCNRKTFTKLISPYLVEINISPKRRIFLIKKESLKKVKLLWKNWLREKHQTGEI
jgi:hypothetical protein